jgi:hypothetical protein
VFWPFLCLIQLGSPDTLRIRSVERPPAPGEAVDSFRFGGPQLRIPTKQGTALVWLLRAADSLFVAAMIPDSTLYWGDDFVLSLNISGEAGASPGDDDFQWYFRRVIDSSVVYRGRDGRWQAPRSDPDWRLGAERGGGGWEVSTRDDRAGWSLVLRLDPAWLAEGRGKVPRIAFRIYDDSPQGWFAWPLRAGVTPVSVEQTPALWGHVQLPAPPPG